MSIFADPSELLFVNDFDERSASPRHEFRALASFAFSVDCSSLAKRSSFSSCQQSRTSFNRDREVMVSQGTFADGNTPELARA